jgi:rod shape-determining protein MreC
VVTRQRPRSTRLLVVVFVTISLAVITVDYRQGEEGPLAALGRTTVATMAPMQRAVTTVTEPVGNFFSGIAHLPSLARENRELTEEVADLKTQLQVSAFKQQDYEALLDLLGLSQGYAGSTAARVIANGVSNFEWTITIDKGSGDGLAVDMPVVVGTASAARLVGRVIRVTDGASDVQLIIDRRAGTAAVLGTSREGGLVEGQGESDLKMTLVERGTPVEGNEQVFTQGYEVNGQTGLYPPGILIGQVSRSISGRDDVQEFVTVRPAVDFASLTYVLVLRTTEQTLAEGGAP